MTMRAAGASWISRPSGRLCYMVFMLGTTGRIAMILSIVALAGVALAGCLKNVPQDSNSGKDYRFKGAKPIRLEDGEGRVRDIVTYPGGDRVDWKVVELPEGQQGDLRLRLSWQPPRPGLDVAFGVFNEFFEPVGDPRASRTSSAQSRKLKLRNAKGKYYIQVYAPKRMDAGRYTLSVRFKERKPVALPTLEELAGKIEDPPVLPAVEEPKPEEPKPEEPPPPPPPVEPEPEPEPEPELEPIAVRITRTQAASGNTGTIITLAAGKRQGVDKSWTGVLLRNESEDPVPGSEFEVIRVTDREAVAKVPLSLDQVKNSLRAELRPPEEKPDKKKKGAR